MTPKIKHKILISALKDISRHDAWAEFGNRYKCFRPGVDLESNSIQTEAKLYMLQHIGRPFYCEPYKNKEAILCILELKNKSIDKQNKLMLECLNSLKETKTELGNTERLANNALVTVYNYEFIDRMHERINLKILNWRKFRKSLIKILSIILGQIRIDI